MEEVGGSADPQRNYRCHKRRSRCPHVGSLFADALSVKATPKARAARYSPAGARPGRSGGASVPSDRSSWTPSAVISCDELITALLRPTNDLRRAPQNLPGYQAPAHHAGRPAFPAAAVLPARTRLARTNHTKPYINTPSPRPPLPSSPHHSVSLPFGLGTSSASRSWICAGQPCFRYASSLPIPPPSSDDKGLHTYKCAVPLLHAAALSEPDRPYPSCD